MAPDQVVKLLSRLKKTIPIENGHGASAEYLVQHNLTHEEGGSDMRPGKC